MRETWILLVVAAGASLLLGPAPPVEARQQPASPVAQRFAAMDADGDGRLTVDEAPAPRLFARMDADGDGSVTLEEAEAALGATAGAAGEAPSTAAPAAAEATDVASSGLAALLARPGVDLVLEVSDLARSLEFYRDGIGMAPVGETRSLADGASVAELKWGQTIFELRRPPAPPAETPVVAGAAGDMRQQIVAANGFRLIYLLVDDQEGIVKRLPELGFRAPEGGATAGIGGYFLAEDPDGNIVGLQTSTMRGRTRPESLQMALTVSDVPAAQAFYGGVLGLAAAGQIPIRSMSAIEYRHAAGQSIVKFWAPPGERPSFGGPVGGRIGVRALRFPVTDLAAARRLVEGNGGVVLDEPAALAGEKGFVLTDPDGHRVLVVERAPSSGGS